MIQQRLLLCAEGVVVDQLTNNLSVFNILDELHFQTLPAILPKMVIISVLDRDQDDPAKYEARLKIDLAGLKVMEMPIEYNFQNRSRTRNMITMGGLPITSPGVMEIHLDKDDVKLASYTIYIAVPLAPTVDKKS
jgi:hypothetical protein